MLSIPGKVYDLGQHTGKEARIFELTGNALLIDFVVAVVLGFGWTIGCAIAQFLIGKIR